MDIISGKRNNKAERVVIYGPEGIGKSTFAAAFPNALFSDTEGSTDNMDVKRFQDPTSWSMLMQQALYVKANPQLCSTYIIDTADWAEKLCSTEITAKAGVNGIEGFGYGKGYTYLEEAFGKYLNLLRDIADAGTTIVVTAHAVMRKFEQPDELGAYDRWELKLQKKTAALLKEWASVMLFANYETYVVNVDGQGVQKGKNKVQGGKRVLYTAHHPCWDAKNRHGMPEKMDFDYAKVAPYLNLVSAATENVSEPIAEPDPEPITEPEPEPAVDPNRVSGSDAADKQAALKELYDLMNNDQITRPQLQSVVAGRGYFPADTPIENYPVDFIRGCLIGAWPQVSMAAFNEVVPF